MSQCATREVRLLMSRRRGNGILLEMRHSIEVAFCSACGAATIASAQSSQSAEPSVTSANIDEALEIFVGKNYEYYKRKWEIIVQNKSHISWNWAAFFFVTLWMPYRKMYLYSFVYLSALIIETLFEYAVKIPHTSILSYAINIAIWVIVGLYGNYWYKFRQLSP